MAKPAAIPAHLRDAPVSLDAARRAGLTRDHLRSSRWRRIGPGIYAWSAVADEPRVLLQAARERLSPLAVFSGLTAAWAHGLDVAPCAPIQVVVPHGHGPVQRSGLLLSRVELVAEDITTRLGLRVTSMERTLVDLCNQLPLVEAVVIADLALAAGLVDTASLHATAERRRGRLGVRRFRELVDLADGRSESPMETRLRCLLVRSGLPPPELQVNLTDRAGSFLARADLYYERARLAIEYDGESHRETLAEDNRRQNRLLAAGYRLLRFTARDFGQPDRIVALVRGHLSEAGPAPVSGWGTQATLGAPFDNRPGLTGRA